MDIAFFQLEPSEKERIEKDEELKKLSVSPIFFNTPLDENHIPSQKQEIEAVCVFVGSQVTKNVLDQLPKLQFIATRSTGYDHIDVRAAEKKGVVVSNVPSYGDETVAEFTFGLILTLSRKIYDAYDRIRETGSFNLSGLRGFDLKGKTLGVIGTGRIGRNVIRIAKGFEMKVLAHDLVQDTAYAKEMGFEYVGLEELLQKSDIVTLHVPYTKGTHHLINAETLKLMRASSYLINTSRGPVVETAALVEALSQNKIAGAGLDVLEEEGAIQDEMTLLMEGHPEEYSLRTLLANHILIDMPNVIITPHNAFNTKGALDRILDTTIDNIVSFIKGNPINVVHPVRGLKYT